MQIDVDSYPRGKLGTIFCTHTEVHTKLSKLENVIETL